MSAGLLTAVFRAERAALEALFEARDFEAAGGLLERRIVWEEKELFPAVARKLSAFESAPPASCRGCSAGMRPGLGLREAGALDASEMRCPACGFAALAAAGEEHERLRRANAGVLRLLRAGDAAGGALAAKSLRSSLARHDEKEERALYPACDAFFTLSEARRLLETLNS